MENRKLTNPREEIKNRRLQSVIITPQQDRAEQEALNAAQSLTQGLANDEAVLSVEDQVAELNAAVGNPLAEVERAKTQLAKALKMAEQKANPPRPDADGLLPKQKDAINNLVLRVQKYIEKQGYEPGTAALLTQAFTNLILAGTIESK